MHRVVETLFTMALLHHQQTTSSKENSGFQLVKNLKKLYNAREIAALMLHHDAITGTSKRSVIEQYEQQYVISEIFYFK